MTIALTRQSQPFTGLIESFFQDPVFSPFLRRSLEDQTNGWIPAVDLSQTEDGYVVTADLPGLAKEDVEVTLENNTLTLTGERKFERSTEGQRFDRIERAYGKFVRTFQLPTNVNASGVGAQFKDGVLTVTVPKAEQAKSRKIAIG